MPIPFERGTKSNRWVESQAEAKDEESESEETLAIAAAADSDERKLALAFVEEARRVVNYLDPVGVGARDLKECLLIQIHAQQTEAAMVLRRRLKASASNGFGPEEDRAASLTADSDRTDVFSIATHVVTHCLVLLQKKDMRELTRSCGRTPEEVQAAVEFIRTLDPRPGQRYNQSETRLIEPDVAFVKRDDKFVVVMNEEDMPTLRLNQGYRKMLQQKQTEKEVKEYVKERYKSAIQLLRNIEQRKNTIVRDLRRDCPATVRSFWSTA